MTQRHFSTGTERDAGLERASRAYVLEIGCVVLEGDSKKVAKDEAVKKAYLGG
jgi:ABC-type lipopolysaccharide export system ATPase subunit